MDREEQNRLILAELARLYPDARPALHFANPFELLVAVMLSAQCTDVKVNMVTPALFAAYPDAAALAKAEPAEIEPIIKTCGLFHNKAKNLVLMARELTVRFGGEVPADVDELQKLPGVGRKTANCVMCEAFKDPQGIAVDTHVFRIAHRLKLAGPSADTPQKVEDILLKVYPREQWLFINHQWVHFGREFCRARNPRCADCIVGDLCPTRGLWG